MALLLPAPDELRDRAPPGSPEERRRRVGRAQRRDARPLVGDDELGGVAGAVLPGRVEDDRHLPRRGRGRRRQPEDLASRRVRHVDVPPRVLPDVGDPRDRPPPGRDPLRGVVPGVRRGRPEAADGKDLAGAVVREQVAPGDLGHGGPARHDASRHRAALRARGVRVLRDREGQVGSRAACGRVVAVRPFHPPPAVVRPPRRAGRLEVDLLPRALPDVSDPEVARDAVEGEAPGVPEALRPDLGERARPAGVRVVGRDGVLLPRVPGVDVDAEELPEPRPVALREVLRVPAAPAVAEAERERAVDRREREVAAVVVRVGLRLPEEDALAPGVRDVGDRGDGELGDDRVAGRVGVVHEEAAVVGVVGVEREAEEPALAPGADPRREVEEARPEEGAVLHDPDPPPLLDDEESVEVPRGGGRPERGDESRDDEDRLDRGLGRRGPEECGREEPARDEGRPRETHARILVCRRGRRQLRDAGHGAQEGGPRPGRPSRASGQAPGGTRSRTFPPAGPTVTGVVPAASPSTCTSSA